MIPERASKGQAEENIKALVAFLSHGLTDERVTCQKAPFDHPQLFIPHGAPDKNPKKDQLIELPPVGETGATTPLPTFLGREPSNTVSQRQNLIPASPSSSMSCGLKNILLVPACVGVMILCLHKSRVRPWGRITAP